MLRNYERMQLAKVSVILYIVAVIIAVVLCIMGLKDRIDEEAADGVQEVLSEVTDMSVTCSLCGVTGGVV